MKLLVASNPARNLWAIMKQFNKLPNDPLLRTMTSEQMDFTLLSMNRDVEEANAQLRGGYIESDFRDESYDDIMNATDDEWEIMVNGQDANEIYKQVVELTGDDAYEDKVQRTLDNFRNTGIDQIMHQKEETLEYQQEQIKLGRERAKKLEETGKAARHKANSVISWDSLDDDEFEEL